MFAVGADQAGGRALGEDAGLGHHLGVLGEGLLPREHQGQRPWVGFLGEQAPGQVDGQQADGAGVVGHGEGLGVAEAVAVEQVVQGVERVGHGHRHAARVDHETDVPFASAQLRQGVDGGAEQVGQLPVRVQSQLVQAVEAAEESKLTWGQAQSLAHCLDGHGVVGEVDGHCLQCGHAG